MDWLRKLFCRKPSFKLCCACKEPYRKGMVHRTYAPCYFKNV